MEFDELEGRLNETHQQQRGGAQYGTGSNQNEGIKQIRKVIGKVQAKQSKTARQQKNQYADEVDEEDEAKIKQKRKQASKRQEINHLKEDIVEQKLKKDS